MSTTSPSQRIKRPRNAWVIFRQVKSKEYRDTHPGDMLNLPNMSKTISGQWSVAPTEVKQYYYDLAKQENENLLAIYPDYKYQPRKKGSRRKQKRTSAVKEGGVTKRSTAKKKGTVSTPDLPPTLPVGVHGEWPEANTLAPDSNNFGELVPAVASNDQSAVADSNHTFYDNTLFSPDASGMNMPDYAAQLMAYSGQQFVDANHTAMQPFVTFDLNAYQSGGQMAEGYAANYDNELHTDDGRFQHSNMYRANSLYEQTTGLLYEQSTGLLYQQTTGLLYQQTTGLLYEQATGLLYEQSTGLLYKQATEVDTAGEPSGAYATAYSQDEGGSGHSTQDIAAVDADSLQDLDAFLAWGQESQYRPAESMASASLFGI